MTRPLAVRERNAAKMLDMTPAEFRELRAKGILPPPASIGGIQRWRVEDLERIVKGESVRPAGARFEV